MKNKKFYILLTVLPALILLASLNLDGKTLSTRAAAVTYSDYTRITNNEESISVSVPVEWTDIDMGPWTYQGRSSGSFLAASTDLGAFNANGSAPGVLIGVSDSLARTYGKDHLLSVERTDVSRRCAYTGRANFQGLFYQGRYDNYSNCVSGGPNLRIFTTTSADQKLVIMVRIAIHSDADLEAASKILETFQVLGDPAVDPHHDH